MIPHLGRDMVWNLASFALVALAGVLINVVIGRVYGPAVLGVFNQAVAVYILLSQLSVFGVQLSVLRQVSVLSGAEGQGAALARAITTGLVAASLTSLLVLALAWPLGPLLATAFNSPELGRAWPLVAPALLFFSWTKVLLNAVNGLHQLRAFAIGQALRYLLALAALFGFILTGAPGHMLPLMMVLAEGLLALGLGLWLLRQLRPSLGPAPLADIRAHLRFGGPGMLAGAMSELNTRVDVLVLGLFLDDAAVGVYTIAAMIYEGLLQVAIVLRNIANPSIARLYAAGRLDELAGFLARLRRQCHWGMAGLCLVAVAAYPLFTRWILADPGFDAGWAPLAILCAGLALAAGWLPAEMLLVQAGRPGLQSLTKAVTLGANLALNLLLVPVLGLAGAAAGTALALVLWCAHLRHLARRRLGLAF